MSPEKQRIAIAEACGKCSHTNPHDWEHRGPEGDRELYCKICNDSLSDIQPPDYLNDLNAMHEVLKEFIIGRTSKNGFSMEGLFAVTLSSVSKLPLDRLWQCSAGQMADAFLLTIGKWEEDK